MVSTHSDQLVNAQAYLNFLNDAQTAYPGESKTGVHLYTPRSNLLRYFTDRLGSIDELLSDVLKEEERIPASDIVLQQYLAVLSILVSIGQARFFCRFVEQEYNDERLPFFDRPRRFPKDGTESFFDAFFDAQWRFCPVKLSRTPINLQIEPEQIIPLKSKIEVYSQQSSRTFEVELHEDYDPFLKEASTFGVDWGTNKPRTHNYLFKEFTKASKPAYDKELTAFLCLQKNGQLLGKTIIGFHGSFIHEDTYTIILEKPELGSLDDFMDAIPPPTSSEDITRLWESLLKLQEALHAIHNINAPYAQDVKQYSLLRGWHQDLKPENIVVVGGQTDSDYDCEFRIADLGTLDDAQVTKSYLAPECFHGSSGDTNRQMADVWSLGCIYSEFAVWVAMGLAGLKGYRADRDAECVQLGMQEFGSFHDGNNLLRSVSVWNKQAAENRSNEDRVTEAVLQQLVDEMLFEDGDARPSTRQLNMRIKRIINRAREQHLSDLRRGDSVASSNSTFSSFGLASPRSLVSRGASVRSDTSDEWRLSYDFPMPPRLGRTGTGRSADVQRDSFFSTHPIEEEKEVFVPSTRDPVSSSIPALSTGRSPPPIVTSIPTTQTMPIGATSLAHDSNASEPVPLCLTSPSQTLPRLSGGHTSANEIALINGDDKEIAVSRGPRSSVTGAASATAATTADTISGVLLPKSASILVPAPLSLETGIVSDINVHKDVGRDARPLVHTLIEVRPDNDPRRTGEPEQTEGLVRSISGRSGSLPIARSHRAVRPETDFQRSASSPTAQSVSLEAVVPRVYKPYLDMIDGLLWLNQKKGAASSATLPNEKYLSQLADRDFIFLIDDSVSMRTHREMTSRAVRLLSWLLKKYDKNGMDLYFTRKADKTHARAGHSSDLQRPLLKALDECHGKPNATARLTQILQDFRARSATGTGAAPEKTRSSFSSFASGSSSVKTKTVVGAKKIMIFVITDGNWDDGVELELAQSMSALGTTLSIQGAPDKAVAIQFIRTTKEPSVRERLVGLKNGDYSGRITTDTAYLEGNVFRMLLGAISDLWDDEDDTETFSV